MTTMCIVSYVVVAKFTSRQNRDGFRSDVEMLPESLSVSFSGTRT